MIFLILVTFILTPVFFAIQKTNDLVVSIRNIQDTDLKTAKEARFFVSNLSKLIPLNSAIDVIRKTCPSIKNYPPSIAAAQAAVAALVVAQESLLAVIGTRVLKNQWDPENHVRWESPSRESADSCGLLGRLKWNGECRILKIQSSTNKKLDEPQDSLDQNMASGFQVELEGCRVPNDIHWYFENPKVVAP